MTNRKVIRNPNTLIWLIYHFFLESLYSSKVLKIDVQFDANYLEKMGKCPSFETRFSQNQVIKKKKKNLELYSGILRSI